MHMKAVVGELLKRLESGTDPNTDAYLVKVRFRNTTGSKQFF